MKKILSTLLLLALLLSMATGALAETAGDAASGHYPIAVTDQAGREVTIEDEPEKLVSGYYISTSLLIALDLDEKLVGVEAKADKRAIYRLGAPALIDLPSVGTAKEFDLEGCVAAATDTEENAQALLDFTEAQEAFLSEALADVETPSVYLAGNSSVLNTAGNAMYQADMIRMAGGVNVAAEIEDTYWAEIDYEQLLAWDPEYIILASDAAYTVDDVLADPNLAGCTAVANSHVYQIPNKAEAWDSPVPSGILGSVWLANVLHADRVSDDECASRIDAYYEAFYNFTYSEN